MYWYLYPQPTAKQRKHARNATWYLYQVQYRRQVRSHLRADASVRHEDGHHTLANKENTVRLPVDGSVIFKMTNVTDGVQHKDDALACDHIPPVGQY